MLLNLVVILTPKQDPEVCYGIFSDIIRIEMDSILLYSLFFWYISTEYNCQTISILPIFLHILYNSN